MCKQWVGAIQDLTLQIEKMGKTARKHESNFARPKSVLAFGASSRQLEGEVTHSTVIHRVRCLSFKMRIATASFLFFIFLLSVSLRFSAAV